MLEVGSYVTAHVRLLRPLGAGGMGRVWLAEHEGLHAEVVVKFLAEDLEGDADAIARFAREAAAASRVKSPHVVQMLDHGVTPDGQPYIVMEHLEGRDLGAWLDAQGVLSLTETREIVVQLSRALEKAHQSGIVHRDIKPENIFLCDAGDGALFVKLLDFGIAKGAARLDGRGTATGNVMGSPFYMSPEQLTGARDLGPPTDLWSVGVVIFELLTGRRPYEAETIGALALKVHQDPFPDALVQNPSLPASLRPFFARACAKNPADRFSRAAELAEAFSRVALGGTGPMAPVSLPPTSAPKDSGRALPGVASEREFIALARTEATTDRSLGLERNASQPPRARSFGWLVVAVFAGIFAIGGLLWALRRPPVAATAQATAATQGHDAPASAQATASASSAVPSPLASVEALPTPNASGISASGAHISPAAPASVGKSVAVPASSKHGTVPLPSASSHSNDVVY